MKIKSSFERMLKQQEYSDKSIQELRKWYDFREERECQLLIVLLSRFVQKFLMGEVATLAFKLA